MRKNYFKFSLALFFVWLLFFAAQAKADASSTIIRLQIKTNDASLYDQDITVTACSDSSTASTTTVNAKCAIEQSGLLNDWSWWGDDAFLNSVGGYINNDAGNGVYWGWFSNLEYGQVALNKHELIDGEKLLLTYDINPLKISTDNILPYINATSTIILEQFGLDASWNPAWSLAASSTLVIDGQNFDSATGTYEYIATTTAPILIYGKKDGYINSDSLTVTAQEPQDNGDNPDPPPAPAGGSVIIVPQSSGGGASTPLITKVDLIKAVDFLTAKQAADGSFGSALQTDWAAVAFGSFNPDSRSSRGIRSYLLIDPDPLAGMNQVSDYARRAMALMSLNINPYNGTKTNYIKKITDLHDGQQFGDSSLYNDDIFALLVLNKAGFSADDEMIKQAVNFVIAKQQADGSWEGTDLTAAAIQALTPLAGITGVNSALQKARNFLFNAQSADGGFGNVFTTAWVLQAISALGENVQGWQKNGNTPENFLALSQGDDGGLDKDNSIEANRVWATAYAIPAVQGRSWFNILNSFIKENIAAVANEPIINLPASDDSIATSTSSGQATSTLELEVIATSTLDNLNQATSTPADLNQATSTPIAINIEGDKKEKAKSAAGLIIKSVKPKVLGKKITKNSQPQNNIQTKELSDEKIASTAAENLNFLTPPAESISENKILKGKVNQNAKKVLLVAGGGAILAGILLILKLLGFLL